MPDLTLDDIKRVERGLTLTRPVISQPWKGRGPLADAARQMRLANTAQEERIRSALTAIVPVCRCGHPHTAGADGEDLGCARCPCSSFTASAPAGTREGRDKGEKGWRPAKGERVEEVIVTQSGEVIVLGAPAHDDDDNDSGHDCDAMGCGQAHVLHRAPFAAPPAVEARDEDTRRLDWLERRHAQLIPCQVDIAEWDGWNVWDDITHKDLGDGETIRAAIDAAMSAARSPETGDET